MMLVWLVAGLVISDTRAHHLVLRAQARPLDGAPSPTAGVFRSFGWSLSMLAGQPDDIPNTFTRVLAILWAFVGIIFVAFYTATLTANLTVEKFDSQINSPADAASASGSARRRDRNRPSTSTRSVAPRARHETTATRICGAANSAAIVFDAPVLRFYANHEGAGVGQICSAPSSSRDYGVAFPNGSEMRKQFNQGLLSMREDGTYELIKQKWFGSGTPARPDRIRTPASARPLCPG